MKKIFKSSVMALAVFVMMGCAFSSCSKDDDNEPSGGGENIENGGTKDPTKALVGTWFADLGKDGTWTYKFNANGTGQEISEDDYWGREVEDITWEATETNLYITYEDGETEGGHYSLSKDGNTLTWVGETFTRK